MNVSGTEFTTNLPRPYGFLIFARAALALVIKFRQSIGFYRLDAAPLRGVVRGRLAPQRRYPIVGEANDSGVERMKALSIRQPWADLILAGVKTSEYRSWQVDYRGPLLIHAAKRKEPFADVPRSTPRGGFVGVVNLIDIVPTGDVDPDKRYAWVFVNPRRIPFVAAKGRLGLFDPPPELLRS
jgi:ASCH domain